MISKESKIRCPYCAEVHPAGTRFCPNTGKPLKGKGKKIIFLFVMPILIGAILFFVYNKHIRDIPRLKSSTTTSIVVTTTSVSSVSTSIISTAITTSTSLTTSIPEDIANCDMKYAQKVLEKLFRYSGKTDGVPNPDFEIALKNFQMFSEYDLKPTGKLDSETCDALRKAEKQY